MAKHRILIVDDDKDILQIIKLTLRDQYEVITATDGFSGLQKAQAVEPDLFILDIRMPKVDGHQLIDAIHHSPKFYNVPIIVITAHADPEDEYYAMQQGVSAYIPKPFEMPDLVKKINEVLQNKPVREKVLTYEEILAME
ncbi:MAG: response regulator [bacterium]|nr:response regulator [bacterium]